MELNRRDWKLAPTINDVQGQNDTFLRKGVPRNDPLQQKDHRKTEFQHRARAGDVAQGGLAASVCETLRPPAQQTPQLRHSVLGILRCYVLNEQGQI